MMHGQKNIKLQNDLYINKFFKVIRSYAHDLST